MMLKESAVYPVEPTKVLLVKRYLDKEFVKGTYTTIKAGTPQVERIALYKNPTNGEPIEDVKLSPRQVFDNLEAEFKTIYNDKVRRTKFLQQVLKDWFNDRITVLGMLSVNNY